MVLVAVLGSSTGDAALFCAHAAFTSMAWSAPGTASNYRSIRGGDTV